VSLRDLDTVTSYQMEQAILLTLDTTQLCSGYEANVCSINKVNFICSVYEVNVCSRNEVNFMHSSSGVNFMCSAFRVNLCAQDYHMK